MQNSDATTVLILVAVVLIALAIGWYLVRRRKTEALRDRFGEEYERTLSDVGKRSEAERNLEEREKRVAELSIRPLTIEERDGFSERWRDVKAQFVDSPREAMEGGDRLLGEMMATRGFPMGEFDRRYEDLSVNHAEVARHYRAGHDIADKQDQATTEEMRRAMNHYEKLYDELVLDAGTAIAPRDAGADTDAQPDPSTPRVSDDFAPPAEPQVQAGSAPGERPVRPD